MDEHQHETALDAFLDAPCADGGDHLVHIWPVELFQHAPEPECICAPDFVADGFYFLHYGVGDDSPLDTRRSV